MLVGPKTFLCSSGKEIGLKTLVKKYEQLAQQYNQLQPFKRLRSKLSGEIVFFGSIAFNKALQISTPEIALKRKGSLGEPVLNKDITEVGF